MLSQDSRCISRGIASFVLECCSHFEGVPNPPTLLHGNHLSISGTEYVGSRSAILYRRITALNVCDQLMSDCITLLPLEQRWILSLLLTLFFLVQYESFQVCRPMWFTGQHGITFDEMVYPVGTCLQV